MAEQHALPPLVLIACLLPTTSASAIAETAVGVATSSLAVELASKTISVTLLARHPFWSVLRSKTNRIDDTVSLYIDMLIEPILTSAMTVVKCLENVCQNVTSGLEIVESRRDRNFWEGRDGDFLILEGRKVDSRMKLFY